MTLSQAKKLKVGDRVLWPKDANWCTETVGTVCLDEQFGNLFVRWDDSSEGERTYLNDREAVFYIKRA